MISISDLGGPTAVARMTGLSVPTVHGWKAIPYQHCPTIERATNGKYVCEDMRPDQKWVRIADEHWPNPSGRPLLDLSVVSAEKVDA